MSLVYEEFPSDLPPSMSDEEIELLKIKYRESHSNKHKDKSEVKGDSEGDATE